MFVADDFRPTLSEIVCVRLSTVRELPLGWMAAFPLQRYEMVADRPAL